MVFSSGLAATTNVVAMLDSGDAVVTMDDLYGSYLFVFCFNLLQITCNAKYKIQVEQGVYSVKCIKLPTLNQLL